MGCSIKPELGKPGGLLVRLLVSIVSAYVVDVINSVDGLSA